MKYMKLLELCKDAGNKYPEWLMDLRAVFCRLEEEKWPLEQMNVAAKDISFLQREWGMLRTEVLSARTIHHQHLKRIEWNQSFAWFLDQILADRGQAVYGQRKYNKLWMELEGGVLAPLDKIFIKQFPELDQCQPTWSKGKGESETLAFEASCAICVAIRSLISYALLESKEDAMRINHLLTILRSYLILGEDTNGTWFLLAA